LEQPERADLGDEMSGDVELKISKDVVKPILEAKVRAALLESLDAGYEQIVHDMLNHYMNEKVDSKGKPSDYRGDANRRRIDFLLNNCIEEAVKSAIVEHVQKDQEKLAGEVQKYFKSKKGSNKLSRAVSEGLLQNITNSWRFTVNVNVDPPRN
jgi:preprotein translocase subunit SecA